MICYRIFLLSSGIFNRLDAICECWKSVSVQNLKCKHFKLEAMGYKQSFNSKPVFDHPQLREILYIKPQFTLIIPVFTDIS